MLSPIIKTVCFYTGTEVCTFSKKTAAENTQHSMRHTQLQSGPQYRRPCSLVCMTGCRTMRRALTVCSEPRLQSSPMMQHEWHCHKTLRGITFDSQWSLGCHELSLVIFWQALDSVIQPHMGSWPTVYGTMSSGIMTIFVCLSWILKSCHRCTLCQLLLALKMEVRQM